MTNNHLEGIARDYHMNQVVKDKFIEDISQDYFCEWVKNSFKPNLTVCEMGYGEGITASHLSGHFQDYTVVEGAASLYKLATSELKDISVIHSLFEDYMPSNKYDLILALHILEHVNNPQEILTHIKKWLKPGGKLVILVPNKNSLHRVFANKMGLIDKLDELSERDIQVGHQRVFGLSALITEVIDAGYNVLSEHGFFLKTLPNSMMLKFDHKLIWELNKISTKLDPSLLANICVVCELKK
jgi:SAM-dependent methyltransferase